MRGYLDGVLLSWLWREGWGEFYPMLLHFSMLDGDDEG